MPANPPAVSMNTPQYVYQVRPRKDTRGFDLISGALPFGRLWYYGPNTVSNAIGGIAQVYLALASVWKTSSHFPPFFTQMLPLLYVPDMSLPSEVC